MPETIAAVYENGVFRPLSSVSFKDGETVQIQIVAEESSEELKDDREKAIKLMDLRKLMGLPTKQFKLDAAAEQKRRELFEKLKGRVGKPLSEIVIDDRGPW
ncbi:MULTISPECIES: antitoxin family protein [unclassified Microcoleus]|uniref:antitoxin family protein n=1 Tax=unclassified Microcoleus TaxID=2642155 RepID=UPI0025EF8380|nr:MULTISPECIES: antitoxin family protein [unclassified Microcoleus]